MTVIDLRNSLEPMTRSIDNDGLIVDCNQKYARMMGHTRNEIIGMDMHNHTPESSHAKLNEIFELWKDGQSVNNEIISLITKHGNVFDVYLTIENEVNRKGKVIRSNNSMLDYGEVADFQELVRTNKYKSLYEESKFMYRTVNINGIIVDCNKTYHTRLGYTKAEVIGRSLVKHTADSNVSDILINMAKWRLNAESQPIAIRLKAKNGETIPVKISATNLRDEKGLLLGRNFILQDITAEEETQRKLQQYQEKEEEKHKLTINMIQDLKKHATLVMSNTGAISDSQIDSAGQQSAVDTIKKNSLSLDHIINSLLSKYVLDKQTVEAGKFSIVELCDNVAGMLKMQLDMKKQELIVQREPEITVVSDYETLQAILLNLIYNAMSVAPDDGKISVKITQDGDYVKFSVSDNGVRMPEKKAKKLFKKSYYNQDTKQTINYADMALLMCDKLAKKLNGQLTMENEGKGTGNMISVTIKNSDV